MYIIFMFTSLSNIGSTLLSNKCFVKRYKHPHGVVVCWFPDEEFAVGTSYGGVYICKLTHRVEPIFYQPLTAEAPVMYLKSLDTVRTRLFPV